MSIDPGVLTLVQSTFLQNINAAFASITQYALDLLYLFASVELVILGLVWALQHDVAWERLFFKVIKIGLIFFIIQNYTWLLDTIIRSFAQLAGTATESGGDGLTHVIFNPATIWQYGYDTGLHLLQLATINNNFGLVLILVVLGVGILFVFGLLGIQIVLQLVGFYLTAFTSLIMIPFGTFEPSRGMFDKAVQALLKSGVRVMALMIVVGIAVTTWSGFQLGEQSPDVIINISQPLGLFFTALLFLFLAIYLPRIASEAVGSIGGFFSNGAASAPAAVHVTAPAAIASMPVFNDIAIATAIDKSPQVFGGQQDGMMGSAAALSPQSVVISSSGREFENSLLSKNTLSQASAISKNTKNDLKMGKN